MEQDQDVKKKKFRCYKEVTLRVADFKKACELDTDELKNIQDEYFKRTFVYPLIGIFISAAFFALWPAGVIYKVNEFSETFMVALMFLAAFGAAMGTYLFFRCIYALTIVSKIKKQDFWWRTGIITRKKRLWIPLSMRFYYIVDDEYCSQRYFDPFYRKGTEVYFLYFPEFMKGSYMGGVVVRKKD